MSLELKFAIFTTLAIFVSYWIGKQVGRIRTYIIYSKAMNNTLNDLVKAMKDCEIEGEKVDKITRILNLKRHKAK